MAKRQHYPAEIRNVTGTNKAVKSIDTKASKLADKIKVDGDFDITFLNDCNNETQEEFLQLYEALKSINILAKSDMLIFKQAALTYDILIDLIQEYQNIDNSTNETIAIRLALLDKIDKYRKTLYMLVSKFFVTPEDRFKAALSVAKGDKKKTLVEEFIDG